MQISQTNYTKPNEMRAPPAGFKQKECIAQITIATQCKGSRFSFYMEPP